MKIGNYWQSLGLYAKITVLALIIIGLCISSYVGIFIVTYYELLHPRNGPTIPAHASSRIDIIEAHAFDNGTIYFTAFCNFTSYNDYPIPSEDIYQIHEVFVSLEYVTKDFYSGSMNFSKEASDRQHVSNSSVTILAGDSRLKASEEVTMVFQTNLFLQAGNTAYIGVLATLADYTEMIPSGFKLWDTETIILAG